MAVWVAKIIAGFLTKIPSRAVRWLLTNGLEKAKFLLPMFD